MYRLANTSGTTVSVVIRTLAPTGLLIYAKTTPNIYMAVYLHDGLLKFVFTCGIQTMLFSELHERVNTGFRLSITAKYVYIMVNKTNKHIQGGVISLSRLNSLQGG